MSVVVILMTLISFVFGLAAYFATTSYIVGGVVLGLSLVYFFALFLSHYRKYALIKDRFRICHNFVTNFIISLSVKTTVGAAYESTFNSMYEILSKETKGLEFMSDIEKLEYLKRYFKFDVYSLFLSNILLYQERGGKILEISSRLLNELKNQNEYVNSCASLNRTKFMEIGTLWLFSLGVLVAVRFALNNYFEMISSNRIYQLMVIGVFLFALISIELLAIKAFSLNLKGWKNK